MIRAFKEGMKNRREQVISLSPVWFLNIIFFGIIIVSLNIYCNLLIFGPTLSMPRSQHHRCVYTYKCKVCTICKFELHQENRLPKQPTTEWRPRWGPPSVATTGPLLNPQTALEKSLYFAISFRPSLLGYRPLVKAISDLVGLRN